MQGDREVGNSGGRIGADTCMEGGCGVGQGRARGRMVDISGRRAEEVRKVWMGEVGGMG